MATKDPRATAEKYVRRTQQATTDMVNGVKEVTTNPMQQAAAKEQKLVANWNAAVQEGRWRKNITAISLDDWKNAMINKGAPRVSAGVQAAQSKMESFFAELLPYQAEQLKKLEAMPDLTLEDAIQKQVAWTRAMAQFRRRA